MFFQIDRQNETHPSQLVGWKHTGREKACPILHEGSEKRKLNYACGRRESEFN
jgi:hypothetical protein